VTLAPLLLGVDTGGTFTDFVLWDGVALRVHKVLSTPAAPEQAILRGIADLGIDLARDAARLSIVHGSTVATNAVLEGKGVRTVYIANRGLGDVLSIGRQARAELYDLQPPIPAPPVPPDLCIEVNTRVGADGVELEPLDAAEIARVQARVSALAPQAVAINLLFSFLNDTHERALQAALPARLYVSRSSTVLPEVREYERGIATWLNAWVGPLMQRYLARLAQQVGAAHVSVMQSSGGTMAAERAGELAVHLLLSGPAGGLAGARWIGAQSGRERLLTFDMGGTSTDVALIDGALQLTCEGRIGPYPVAVPMVDVHTIGAGGGSVAYVDAGGMLRVGPESAGADPGPACYGRGGTRATVTDANLVLGRLRPDAFLGGRMPLDVAAAQRAVSDVAQVLGVSCAEAALGIVRVVNEHMTRALRVMSVERGIDPRTFTLLSFGGAGGLHVCALAQALGMRRALVPVHAGVLSALGMIVAPRARRLSRTIARALSSLTNEQIELYLAELTAAGRTALRADGVSADEIQCECCVDLRYHGQSYALTLPWRDAITAGEEFHRVHQARYGHRMQHPIELVTLRVFAHGAATRIALPRQRRAPVAATSHAKNGSALPAWERAELAGGASIAGPALIVESVATTYVEPGWRAQVDAWGNLLLEL
jgi:N-methylhydantoinase A